MHTQKTVTEYRDAIVTLIQDLEREYGVMVVNIGANWVRDREDGGGKRRSRLVNTDITTELT